MLIGVGVVCLDSASSVCTAVQSVQAQKLCQFGARTAFVISWWQRGERGREGLDDWNKRARESERERLDCGDSSVNKKKHVSCVWKEQSPLVFPGGSFLN